ncbi:hypothetical protein KIH74_15145 [Kineosporia sp. J2-2]|uniref:Uncharacterized protein n=1 Tax=Kineosporia corallincola TaxID=2835133 RepID=A0ABS5TJ84_9ACTN|nr:hypothetical protein [Kineosporia corallincola]MBT0770276.1 hypothetical protein [Kineosporia corallincola]
MRPTRSQVSIVSKTFPCSACFDDLEHERRYSPLRAYADATLLNVLFTLGLQARHGDTGIRPVAFDPGNVATNFASETSSRISRLMYRTPLRRLALISPERGGSHLAFFADGTPGTTWQPGRLHARTKPATRCQTNPQMHDGELVEAVWNRSAAMVGL